MADPQLDQYGFPIPEDSRGPEQAPPTGAGESPYEGAPPQRADKRGRGCLFYGCLFTAIGLLLIVVAAIALVYFGLRQLRDSFTAPEPVDIPVVELPEEEMEELEQRFEAFRRVARPDAAPAEPADGAAEAPEAPGVRELSLTAEEINALIAMQPELRGRVLVRIENGRLGGDLSIPLEGIPVVDGRFFNARADFDVAIEAGELVVRLADAEVNGAAVPAEILDQLADQNLAEDAADDPDARRFLKRVESLRVEGDRVILRLRDPTAKAATGSLPAEIEVFEDPLPTE